MVPSMIVVIADRDVHRDAPEELWSRLSCILRIETKHVKDLWVRHVPGVQLVGLRHGESGDDVAPSPGSISVEALDEEYFLSEG